MVNLDTGESFVTRLRISTRTADRLRGLLGTRSLPHGHAMWISPCNSIHTFFMLMTIDVAFLDQELRVIKLIPGMTPWRVCLPVRGAVGVLEGPVEMIRDAKLRKGTRLEIQEDKPNTTDSRGGL